MEREKKRKDSEIDEKIAKCERKIGILESMEVIKPTPTPTPVPTPTPTPEATSESDESTPESEPAEETVLPDEELSYVDEYNELEEDEEEESVKEATPTPEPQKEESVQEPEQKQEKPKETISSLRRFFINTWQATFGITEDENEYLMEPIPEDEQKSRISKLRNQIRKLNDKKKEDDDVFKTTNGQLPPEYLPLFGKEYSIEGDHTAILFKEMKQSWTSCGKFKEFSNGVVKFASGSHCWQTKSGRTTQMRLVCSSENKFISMIEASTCAYEAVFASPVACTDDDLNSLANKTLPELQATRALIGL